jgi:sulfite exporter TauE/SafE
MLLAAFIMGFVGSLHCAAMCGPLVLAMPVVGPGRAAILTSRVIYNSGRIATYSILGVIFGLLGKSLVLAGFQQWLSITAGVTMLAFVFLGHKRFTSSGWRAASWIKATFRTFLHRRTYPAIFALGGANGLLPCGLVYLAGTASAASGDVTNASSYMFVFGLGTLPMMLGIGVCGPAMMKYLQRFRLQPLLPAAVSLVALLLILRGLALGIPYISPEVWNGVIACPSCVR